MPRNVPIGGLGKSYDLKILTHGGRSIVAHPLSTKVVSGVSFARSVSATLAEAAVPPYRPHDYTGTKTKLPWIAPKTITFASCYGAALGPVSNAQMLANATGLRVRSFEKKVNTEMSGSGGRYFTPQGPITASIAAAANLALSPLFKLNIVIKRRLEAS